MKKKLILMSMLLTSSQAFATVTSTQITSSLAKYCVPKPNDVAYGINVCGSILEGTYKVNEDCTCANSEYLMYDDKLRRCRPKCPAGYYLSEESSTKCPAGYYKYEIN